MECNVAKRLACTALLWLFWPQTTSYADAGSALYREPSLFQYVGSPPPPAYARIVLEELGLLGIELANYFKDHDLNSRDWDFSFDWIGLQNKLSTRGYSLDTNHFDTNFITHPFAGMLYYWAARSNRVPVLESFAIGFLVSALWEYLGELRERASLNDLVATPVAGLVLGEVSLQLGFFFDRSCASLRNRMLGALFGPVKSMHDAFDGLAPARDSDCDRYGLSHYGEHDFRLAVGSGALLSGEPGVPMRIETSLQLHTRIVALAGYGAAGEGYTTFADGNVSELWVRGAWAGSEWTDFTLRAELIAFGLHHRSLAGHGSITYGHETLLGLLLGTEYSVHRYAAAAGVLQRDRAFVLDVPGVSLSHRRSFGDTRLELELQASVALAGVDAFALPEYLRHSSADDLTSVARANRYNYAAGISLRPRLRLLAPVYELGAELMAFRLGIITAQDRYPERRSHVSGTEQRTRANLWLGLGPRSWPLRVVLAASFSRRAGALGASRAAISELALSAALEARL